MINGGIMKQHILISALILLSIAGFAWAENIPGLGFDYSSGSDSVAYKQGELIVRFADVEAFPSWRKVLC